MITPKSPKKYWASFSCYQTFSSKEELMDAVDSINSAYQLSPACKAVLNTIKLHAQQFFGVCWLKIAEIAKNANVSVSSVNRALKDLKDAGLLTIHNWMHTLRGGKAHNIYVINATPGSSLESLDDTSSGISDDTSNDTSSEVAVALEPQAIEPSISAHKNLDNSSYSSSDTNSNNNSITKTNSNTSEIRKGELTIPEWFEEEERKDRLKNVPQEFIDIFSPFYADNPEIILARWKSANVAAKQSCDGWENVNWQSVKEAWKETVRRFKAGKINKSDSKGLGGYFYKTLCDRLCFDYLKLLTDRAIAANDAV